jgi:tetratricopeptide (TPR) repeat protein
MGMIARRETGATLAGLLLFALAARVVYAWGLPLNMDEVHHLRLARDISLHPSSFYLPLGSPGTSHPLAVVYLTALADWAGGGRVFVIRLAFIALSLVGLVGVYSLGAALFDRRVGLIALALASVDRHLVALAPVFLESPSMIFLVPWTILSMRRCLVRGLPRDWVFTGLLVGAGYWFSTLFLAVLLPFGFYVLFTGKLAQVLKSRWMYVGAALAAALMSPNVAWNVLHEAVNYERHVGKVGSFGLSPRAALLYVGDLLICLKDPTWIVSNATGKMYLPIYVPCHWVIGLVYLALTAVSLRFWRDERIALLLLVILGLVIPATLVDARESWNEFTWASSTVFAAILLSAFVLDRTLPGKRGAVIVSLVLAYSAGALLWFLSGPKWGYFCPEWERAYLGQVLAAMSRAPYDERGSPLDAATARGRVGTEIRELTDQAFARHGESAMAWYFRGASAESAAEREVALRRSLELAPNNAPVIIARARQLIGAGDLTGARRMLERLLASISNPVPCYELLLEVEQRLGNYSSAVAYARRMLAVKPEDHHAYRVLFMLHDAAGDAALANRALNNYAARHPFGPAAAYLSLAEAFWQRGDRVSSMRFLERAIMCRPLKADDHAAAGKLLRNLEMTGRAMEHFESAARLGSKDPGVYYLLGQLTEEKAQFEHAIAYYRRAVELAPGFAEAHLALGSLLAEQGRVAEAAKHLQAAKRLGFEIPAKYERLVPAAPGTELPRPGPY